MTDASAARPRYVDELAFCKEVHGWISIIQAPEVQEKFSGKPFKGACCNLKNIDR